ncbi:MAG TPA: cytochrome C oxidase subunit IV family protein [Polyangiaceae bacterium]|jgi:cytochrome c oxidase subunit 4|nr:cytochrome C oxidase subunit IV family protein [Polyangiaceae bacterium]
MSSNASAEAHISSGDGNVHVHIASVPFYVGIFVALVFLTVLTVAVSYFDFGAANTVVAMLIATAKASLVATFFMHLRYDSLFNTLCFLAAFVFLAIFILITYDDLGHRGEVDPDYGGTVMPQTGVAAPGSMPATSATANETTGEGPPAAGSGEKK